MQEFEAHTTIRDAARAFEKMLPLSKRKSLGQFFTGMLLGRLLAHLAVDSETTCVLDPMAGSGDLLDASCEAVASTEASLKRLDGVEIDAETVAICKDRLRRICMSDNIVPHVVCGDAFHRETYDTFPATTYDLVITNPPYVRYQTLNGRADRARQGLLAISKQRLTGAERKVWTALSTGYSGFADLSIPAWLLSGLLVQPGGRLALVVPSTWRSRTYADVIRYMLLRCFVLETIVEDMQSGWFSDALVRTHLIVARRLSDESISIPLSERLGWPDARWIQIAPEAANSTSLVGNAFVDEVPEAAFAKWSREEKALSRPGLNAYAFSLENEWTWLYQKIKSCVWLEALEPAKSDLPLFVKPGASVIPVPEALVDLLPAQIDLSAFCLLEDAGIRTGQGLRTGCNRFFYVCVAEEVNHGIVRVMTGPAFGARGLDVPIDALRSVLHRQADLKAWRSGHLPSTRVLDLRRWVLPEDYEAVQRFEKAYQKTGKQLPQVMPGPLADHVRRASVKPLKTQKNARPVSEFSAVRTNERPARDNVPPCFWYMLPDFMPRHLPQAFVPRIIHRVPWSYGNVHPPILIDANFSTFWSIEKGWTTASLTAFLNSTWCRVAMEVVGTPLGGGALKLEAVHLRTMPVPRLDVASMRKLDTVDQCHIQGRQQKLIDRIVLGALLPHGTPEHELDAFAHALYERSAALRSARQKGAS